MMKVAVVQQRYLRSIVLTSVSFRLSKVQLYRLLIDRILMIVANAVSMDLHRDDSTAVDEIDEDKA